MVSRHIKKMIAKPSLFGANNVKGLLTERKTKIAQPNERFEA